MAIDPSTRALTTSLALLLVATLAGADTLPTPYTAEQIRETFRPGLRIVTRTTTPDGVKLSRMSVDDVSDEAATFTDQPVDESGEPTGEAYAGSAGWIELRDHALFPVGSASRERHSATVALGELDGWLYRLEGADGAQTEFFFADDFPGPPVLYRSVRGNQEIYRSEQIERYVE